MLLLLDRLPVARPGCWVSLDQPHLFEATQMSMHLSGGGEPQLPGDLSHRGGTVLAHALAQQFQYLQAIASERWMGGLGSRRSGIGTILIGRISGRGNQITSTGEPGTDLRVQSRGSGW